ncbi:MAG: lysozyme [Prevotella sp.]|nr:lysozyme [Prevotella sp.]
MTATVRYTFTIALLLLPAVRIAAGHVRIFDLPPFERAVACIKYYEGMHTEKDYPYIGYGHRIQPGEHFDLPLTRKQADELLRKDLRMLWRMFDRYGENSLLLATLAYNVGYGTICGNGTRCKSRLLQKIESGDSDIYDEYTGFCRYRGKPVASIRRRRQAELFLIGHSNAR